MRTISRSDSRGKAVKAHERPFRGALVGYGFIGSKGHAAAYAERARARGDVEIVAVADICEPRRAAAAQAFPGARIYPSAEALFGSENGGLDFVDVCTPPSEHATIARAALERGLHVLCEKPLTTTREDAAALLQQAARVRRVLFPCHNYKHAPVVVAIRDIIRSGRIGHVRGVTLQTYRTSHAKGLPDWNTHWRRQLKYSGGGIAMDHGSHSFYLAFDWMGGYPTAISARAFNLEPDRYDTEDNFFAVLSFPSGVATAQLTWTAGVRKVIYTVQGERGAITADDDDLQVAVMKPGAPPGAAWDIERRSVASDWMDASHTRWFNAMFDQFLHAVGTDEFAGKEAQDAYRSIELITVGYESARQNGRELPLAGPHRDLHIAKAVGAGV